MTKKPDAKSPYSQTKEHWKARFDAQATTEKAAGASPKHDIDAARAMLRKLGMFHLSTELHDVAVRALLAGKGVDGELFACFRGYNDALDALALGGASDPRTEAVISPAEKQLVEEAHGVLSALRSAAGKAGESVGRVEDAKPIGRGTRVADTAQSVLDGMKHFRSGAELSGPLLLDAGIGEEELAEVDGWVAKLQAVVESKEARTGAKEARAASIELTLLAVDSAIDLYRSRCSTATRNQRSLLPRALAPLPRSPERRKPANPPGKTGEGADASAKSSDPSAGKKSSETSAASAPGEAAKSSETSTPISAQENV